MRMRHFGASAERRGHGGNTCRKSIPGLSAGNNRIGVKRAWIVGWGEALTIAGAGLAGVAVIYAAPPKRGK